MSYAVSFRIKFTVEKKLKKNYYLYNKINILYVGRLKVEKGIYSLLDIYSRLPKNIKLTLVGNGDNIKINDDRIKLINFVKNEQQLINIYDSTNIFILPSYTEAHPKVIDESLSRMRPVIVFNDIKYVINDRYGVFSIDRNYQELVKMINYLKNNNQSVFNLLKKNKLPQRNEFLKSLYEVIQ